MIYRVFVGYDEREDLAYRVCKRSIEYHCPTAQVLPIKEKVMRRMRLYNRPFRIPETGFRWDTIDGKPYSTEFTYTRFLTPFLSLFEGWSLFVDCDFMFRADVGELFDLANDKYALMCVKHDHKPTEKKKMDGCWQMTYPRKNWSSCMLFNNAHLAIQNLNFPTINGAQGSYMHQMQWCEDTEIGALPIGWNWLEGYSDPEIDPMAVHYTRGGPWFPEYANTAYADEWRKYAAELQGREMVA